jgi:SET domain-containing protein
MNKINFEKLQNNFRIYPLKQEQFKDFQALLYKLEDFQALEFLFSNSRTFEDFQVLYEPC